MTGRNVESADVVVTPSAPARLRPGVYDMWRWALAALWVLVMAVAVVLGSRGSDLGALEADLRDGGVTAVEVEPGLPADATGSLQQRVYWRDGILRHHADVRMVFPGSDDDGVFTGGGVPVRIGRDIAVELAAEQPGLIVTRTPVPSDRGGIYGFDVPAWAALLAVMGAALTFILLVAGPAPWRATRWAWFWLLGTGVGPLLFLLLSGPTWPIPSARPGHRRVRGFWTLLLSLVLGSFWFGHAWS